MAHLDDLVRQVPDARLRREMEQALAVLKRTQRFGLVYEEHLPETTALPGLPILPGALVVRRDAPAAGYLRVTETWDDGTALVVPTRLTDDPDDAPQEMEEVMPVPARELLAVKGFGEPIYAGLTPLGTVERGEADRPHHAVINAENFHALQLLLFLYEGQVDCLYLDPPYNTGARDWKYNNDYVDGTDAWRHSKWLSYMDKRLRLAKRLLKPDGVLIVTIDEHEVHTLGMLLGEIFPETRRQMVTIVINPKGVTQQGGFSRVDEYAFFVFGSGSSASGRGDDYLTPGVEDEEPQQDNIIRRPRWKGLLRSGTNASRKDRKDMFFPVLIDPSIGAVLDVGEALPLDQNPDFETKIKGLVPVWPVRKNKSLGNWGVGPKTLRRLIDQGYVSLGSYDDKRNTWGITYLSKEPQDQIASGVLEIIGRNEIRNVVDVAYTDVASRRLKTVWHRTRHDAGVGGSDVLRAFLGDRVFDFPKSLYAVFDTLAAVLRNRPDALIVDVFAGSGTTLHATALLNAQDGGRRRCVLVTNNEVSEEDTKALHAAGHYRGDAAFEARGIFERATRPRVEAALTGMRADGTPVPGAYLDGRPYADGLAENAAFFRLDYLDPLAVEAGQQFDAVVPLLWLAAGGVGQPEYGAETAKKPFTLPDGSTYGVLLREHAFRAFQDALAARPDVTHVWLVTDSEAAFAEMRALLPGTLAVGMLYRDYLANFRLNTTTPR